MNLHRLHFQVFQRPAFPIPDFQLHHPGKPDAVRVPQLLVATAAAQTVNFFVQKNLVFKSNADFGATLPKFIILAVVLVILSAALPAYSQALFVNMGVPSGLVPTLANIVNILMQVIISYPTMKFWVMPDKK